MKNLLYLLTMLFNAAGCLASLFLTMFIKTEYLIFLPLVMMSCLIFVISFTVTMLIFVNKNTKKNYVPPKSKVVIDYKDYFTSQKSDFIIV